jgi:hypothetical protein
MCYQLKEAADAARSVDTANLKKAIVHWIVESCQSSQPKLHPANKSDRGFFHDDTGRMLCPVELDWNKPEYIRRLLISLLCSNLRRVRAGIRQYRSPYRITAGSWPAFCYENGQLDPQDLEKGFLRNMILLKVRSAYTD